MIIELPSEAGRAFGKRYRMGLFHFSNNNLAVRKACAAELGNYAPEIGTSEDVDLCFRLIQHPTWAACREPGVVIQHKARKTYAAMLRQMWGWGINLGRPYKRTGISGLYVYWVGGRPAAIRRSFEIESTPGLVCVFPTVFHVMMLALLATVGLAVLGQGVAALVALGVAVVAGWFYSADLRAMDADGVDRLRLGLVHASACAVFITAAFVGGLRSGMILVPASMFPPREESRR